MRIRTWVAAATAEGDIETAVSSSIGRSLYRGCWYGETRNGVYDMSDSAGVRVRRSDVRECLAGGWPGHVHACRVLR